MYIWGESLGLRKLFRLGKVTDLRLSQFYAIFVAKIELRMLLLKL